MVLLSATQTEETMNARHLATSMKFYKRSEFAPGEGRRFVTKQYHRAVRRSEPMVIASEIADADETPIPTRNDNALPRSLWLSLSPSDRLLYGNEKCNEDWDT